MPESKHLLRAPARNLNELIIDDRERGLFRVHRSLMRSQDVFRQEQERIFNHCWLYVGHASEVENAGDFRRRRIAGRPMIFTRGTDDVVRVFLNTCPHRGSLICREHEGNTRTLRCFYHGWTFNTEGQLIHVPDEQSFGPNFSRDELGLRQPPRIDSYRGFYFVSLDPHSEDLDSYLKNAKQYLDLIVDQAEEGMRVISGSHKYRINANWKLLVENSLDSYHVNTTHQSYVKYISNIGTDESGRTMSDRPPGVARDLGNGHCVVENVPINGRPTAHWHPIFGEDARDEIARVRQRLKAKFGEKRARKIADTSRNLFIYPNLLILDFVAISIRCIEPLSPDSMDVTAWHLVPQEDTGARLKLRLNSYLTFLGPGGFATPDDIEVLESCATGFDAVEMEWSDISRGMHKDSPTSFDELQMRTFWRHWLVQMQDHSDVLTHENSQRAWE